MINFRLEEKEYRIGNTILPVEELLHYSHIIDGNNGVIELPYSVGDEVIRYPDTLSRAANQNGIRKKIKEFTVFGGKLCVRFEGSNVPHSIECISPI
jgi:hypothetical protein